MKAQSQLPNRFTYWAFISYSHRDEAFCEWLHHRLDGYKTPQPLIGQMARDGDYAIPKKLYPIFRDRDELAAGSSLNDAITTALRNSRYLVVICSPNSAKSYWVNEEVRYFESLGREKYILPIILDGEPNAKEGQEECFPEALRLPKEPIAADSREGKDGRYSALMKLRAGLLGVRLEDLVNRELQRQRKEAQRNGVIALFMLLLTVLALVGGWIAWNKEQEAKAEKSVAQIAREDAEKRRNEAVAAKDRAVKAEENAVVARDDATRQKMVADTQQKESEHHYGLALAEKADRAFIEKRMNEGQIYAAHALARIDKTRGKDAEITRALALGSRLGQHGIPFTLLKGHESFVRSVAFSPNGKMLASGSWDKTVRLWDVASSKQIAQLEGHQGGVMSVSFSPNGKILASGSGDKTIRLWDVASGKQLSQLTGHEDGIMSVTFSPNGKILASAGSDKVIRLWDVATGKALSQLSGHEAMVYSLSFSPDGNTLASAGGDKTVRLWDVVNGKQISQIEGRESWMECVSFSPDGKILASAGGDKTVRLWDAASGKSLARLEGHEGWIESVSFSPDGKTLASGGGDKTVRLWDVASGKQLAQLAWYVESVAFSPDGKTLASGGGMIQLWDISRNKLPTQLEGHQEYLRKIAMSPDKKIRAAVEEDKTIRLSDAASGQLLVQLKGHEGSVESMVFSPDGKLLASGGWDRTVRLWDVASGKPITQFAGHESGVISLTFSPDGKMLASGSVDKTIRLWDVASGKQLAQLKGHEDGVNEVLFSPDGKTLTSVDGRSIKRQWSLNGLFISDWRAQAAADEKRYGLKLQGLKLISCGEKCSP